MLCEFQLVYSHYQYVFGVVDNLSHNIMKADAKLKKERITKFPIPYRDQIQQILDDLQPIVKN